MDSPYEDSPFFPHTRWFSVPGNNVTEWKLRLRNVGGIQPEPPDPPVPFP